MSFSRKVQNAPAGNGGGFSVRVHEHAASARCKPCHKPLAVFDAGQQQHRRQTAPSQSHIPSSKNPKPNAPLIRTAAPDGLPAWRTVWADKRCQSVKSLGKGWKKLQIWMRQKVNIALTHPCQTIEFNASYLVPPRDGLSPQPQALRIKCGPLQHPRPMRAPQNHHLQHRPRRDFGPQIGQRQGLPDMIAISPA